MIKPELGSQGKRYPAAQSLGGRQKNLLFHSNMSNMPKEPCAELGVGAVINFAGVNHNRVQQSI
ncbi:MAG: hypothetical protein ACREIJ_09100 [Nitrospiraceae bacterium]